MSERRFAKLRALLGKPAQLAERLIGGGRTREALLLRLLAFHYASRLRREWVWAAQPPHFFDKRLDAFNLAFRSADRGIFPWYRGFYVTELVRAGDMLLDIGCGDGFFTSRFYARSCKAVDGLDIDPKAIAAARRYNSASNVEYVVCDAITASWPREHYDLIVLDGALGHISPDESRMLLSRVAGALTSEGAFCGSESLGSWEGSDHLQFFTNLETLRCVFAEYFPHVLMREVSYPVAGGERREAFWRCAADLSRFDATAWR